MARTEVTRSSQWDDPTGPAYQVGQALAGLIGSNGETQVTRSRTAKRQAHVISETEVILTEETTETETTTYGRF